MHRDDKIRLRHMLDAAREAVSFARGGVLLLAVSMLFGVT